MLSTNQDFYSFINQHIGDDPSKLRLSKNKYGDRFDIDFAITQIECRKKFANKLPDFLSCREFLFPDTIGGEQSSHQAVARFHKSVIGENNPTLLDMTAGLGVDSLTMALGGCKVTAVEINPFKAEVLNHNAEALGLNNFVVLREDSIKFLSETHEKFDFIFIDPSRRDASNNKVYNLHHCSPDIVTNQDLLLNKADRILIKASPLLDITQILKDFKSVAAIRAIGVKGECKELLIELTGLNQSGKKENLPLEKNIDTIVEAIDLDTDGKVLSKFNSKKSRAEESHISLNYLNESELTEGSYILEPSAMVMKLSPWKELCNAFKARKFSASSHLFLTPEKPENFPGRVTELTKVLTKKDRKSLSGLPASVVSKNYPLTSDEIRKQLKLKEGDQNFIYASRIGVKPVMLLSKSIACG